MCEMIWSRMKVGLLLVLFLSPVFVQVWSKQLDAWINASHIYAAPVVVNAGGGTP